MLLFGLYFHSEMWIHNEDRISLCHKRNLFLWIGLHTVWKVMHCKHYWKLVSAGHNLFLRMSHQRMSWHQCSSGKHQLFHSVIFWTVSTHTEQKDSEVSWDIWFPVHNVFYMHVLHDMQIWADTCERLWLWYWIWLPVVLFIEQL